MTADGNNKGLSNEIDYLFLSLLIVKKLSQLLHACRWLGYLFPFEFLEPLLKTTAFFILQAFEYYYYDNSAFLFCACFVLVVRTIFSIFLSRLPRILVFCLFHEVGSLRHSYVLSKKQSLFFYFRIVDVTIWKWFAVFILLYFCLVCVCVKNWWFCFELLSKKKKLFIFSFTWYHTIIICRRVLWRGIVSKYVEPKYRRFLLVIKVVRMKS